MNPMLLVFFTLFEACLYLFSLLFFFPQIFLHHFIWHLHLIVKYEQKNKKNVWWFIFISLSFFLFLKKKLCSLRTEMKQRTAETVQSSEPCRTVVHLPASLASTATTSCVRFALWPHHSKCSECLFFQTIKTWQRKSDSWSFLHVNWTCTTFKGTSQDRRWERGDGGGAWGGCLEVGVANNINVLFK